MRKEEDREGRSVGEMDKERINNGENDIQERSWKWESELQVMGTVL